MGTFEVFPLQGNTRIWGHLSSVLATVFRFTCKWVGESFISDCFVNEFLVLQLFLRVGFNAPLCIVQSGPPATSIR